VRLLRWPDIGINNSMTKQKQLKIKRSKLPGAGKGLFTQTFIPKGTRITEYKGRINTWKELKEAEDNGYLFYVNRNHVIDALPYKKALARYANDARGVVRQRGVSNNSQYTTEGLKVYITSLRDIQPGEEILVGYGKEYWDIMRENRRSSKSNQPKSSKLK
jgi:SET domain-containing protein